MVMDIMTIVKVDITKSKVIVYRIKNKNNNSLLSFLINKIIYKLSKIFYK